MKNIILTILFLFSINLYADNPSFVLTDSQGNKIHVQDTKNGLIFQEHKNGVLLTMFGHNCPPCREEIAEFIELTKKYGDKLTIISIEVQGYKSEQVEAFRKSNGINYTLLSGDDNINFVRHIVQRSGWNGAIPFLIAIDNKGEVQVVQAGLIKKDSLEDLIKTLNK